MNIEKILQNILDLENENEIIELKIAKNTFDFRSLGQYFSALSNEANLKGKKEGWLIFGVNDEKKVVGTHYREDYKKLHNLKVEIANKTINRISFIEIHEVFHEKGRVILFQIPAAPRGIPVDFEGHYYARNNDSLIPLNIEKIDRIRKQAIIKEDWSANVIENASIEDLDSDAIAFAKVQYLEKYPKFKEEIKTWSDSLFLDKAKITKKGKITNTAILLLGKPESEHFINPANARISWILKDKDNNEKDYIHFENPFLLNVEKVSQKIRNLKYRYIKSGTLFPEEVDQYDNYIIREALHNCIAHQDYTLGGKIVVVENEDGWISFTNSGNFIPKSVEDVVTNDSPESVYRNPFLANAMVNLNMIDTIGSGIKRMYNIQRQKFFPLPEYELSFDKVKVTIVGKVINLDYAKKIAEMPDLSLNEIILLDKISKGKKIMDEEAKILKSKKLIEGRKPNYYISIKVARVTGEKVDYLKQKGIDNNYCKKMIIEYLEKFQSASRKDFENLLLDKLPNILDDNKKKNRIKNILQSLRQEGIIGAKDKIWTLSKK